MLHQAYVHPAEILVTRNLPQCRRHLMRKCAEWLGHIQNKYHLGSAAGPRLARRSPTRPTAMPPPMAALRKLLAVSSSARLCENSVFQKCASIKSIGYDAKNGKIRGFHTVWRSSGCGTERRAAEFWRSASEVHRSGFLDIVYNCHIH